MLCQRRFKPFICTRKQCQGRGFETLRGHRDWLWLSNIFLLAIAQLVERSIVVVHLNLEWSLVRFQVARNPIDTVSEWSKETVLKTVGLFWASWVRIPPPPRTTNRSFRRKLEACTVRSESWRGGRAVEGARLLSE